MATKNRAAAMAKASTTQADTPFAPTSEKQKSLSIGIPPDRHRLLKAAAADAGVTIRSVLLRMIDEIEAETDLGQKLLTPYKTS